MFPSTLTSQILAQSLRCPVGGGYLVYLSDGDVPLFRVSFSPIFSRTGYHLKAKILEQGEKKFFRGHIPVQT